MDSAYKDIARTAREAGVVGAGGAGFPTHVKLAATGIDTVVANGAECEPLLANDQAVMTHRTPELLEGLDLAARAVGATRKVIAIKAKRGGIIAHLQSRAGTQTAEIFKLADYYPAGDEQEIVREVTGRRVPEGGIPPDVGVLVQNVETLVNLARSVRGQPVTRRVLTVAGEVRHPGVVDVPLGMSAREVIAACGGATCDDPVLYAGGPMMGEIRDSLDTPVIKTTSGFFVLPADNFLRQKRSIPLRHILRQAQSACTNCMQCTEVCPRYLLGHKIRPHKIMNAVTLGLSYQSDVIMESFLCMFCGMCEYACPMWLSPRRVYQEVRAGLISRGIRFQRTEKETQDHPMRRFRRTAPDRLVRRYELSGYARKTPDPAILELQASTVRLPTRQGTGSPAVPVVHEGDRVTAGQVIGDIPEGKLGARLHASITGKVTYAGPDEIRIG
ncbi:MAG: electron transport complex protein RnfC [Candidatus Zixiibacteriota bacterium]|nr:MAG: electron transport complex protein RnfC [candidate division Zixibacteria bacterium]